MTDVPEIWKIRAKGLQKFLPYTFFFGKFSTKYSQGALGAAAEKNLKFRRKITCHLRLLFVLGKWQNGGCNVKVCNVKV